MQVLQLALDRQKMEREMAMQELKAEIEAKNHDQLLQRELTKQQNSEFLAFQVAKANMVASLFQSGQSIESIKKAIEIVFP